MKRRSRIIGLFLAGALLFCVQAAAAQRTVVDPLGRTVQVPADPRRVVALAPSVTEIVYALGQEARLVGVTRYSNYPPAAERLPLVGSYIQLDVERI
ncbi:MAG: ABC transporter substrate-binding protein, partial [Desulfatitalea sp.]|nr:ABC transporter substrate-binding protein [Desulfatitalea sp.]